MKFNAFDRCNMYVFNHYNVQQMESLIAVMVTLYTSVEIVHRHIKVIIRIQIFIKEKWIFRWEIAAKTTTLRECSGACIIQSGVSLLQYLQLCQVII